MLAIIPARGGSKGLPRKNILPLCGRPMIEYVIAAARNSTRVNRVVVSTEEEEIAAIAVKAGADVPFLRPAELATDECPNGLACLHVVDGLAQREGRMHEAFALIQPTSPLVRSEDIDCAIDLFLQSEAAAVVSLRRAEVPIESVVEVTEGGRIRNVLAYRYGVTPQIGPRQVYGHRFVFSGAVTIVRTERMRRDVNYYYADPDIRAYIIPDERAVDIDTASDFLLAEALIKHSSGAPRGTFQ